jgi:amino acid transporter
METGAAPDRTQFVRAISRRDATAIVVGSMIGSGIFVVSAEILRTVGSPGLLPVWGVSGLVTLLGALAYGELAAMFLRAGGQYVYLREGISPLFGPGSGSAAGSRRRSSPPSARRWWGRCSRWMPGITGASSPGRWSGRRRTCPSRWRPAFWR